MSSQFYVLMDKQFHLMVETPEANLSRTIQWLGVSHRVWFNRRHRRVGIGSSEGFAQRLRRRASGNLVGVIW